MNNLRIVVTGGGTGGHINPAIAISNEVQRRDEKNEILFIGTKKGMESRLVPHAGYNIEYVDVEGFTPKGRFHDIKVILKFMSGILKCMKILLKFKPDVVVGTGGYVSAPAVMAANFLRIPTLIHEQNAVGGKTSRLLSKFAKRVCITFNDIDILNCPEKTVVTGNPVRKAFETVRKNTSLKEIGFLEGLPVVVCVSGSLGAAQLNQYMVSFIKKHYQEKKFKVVLITGHRYYMNAVEDLKNWGIDTDSDFVKVKKYAHNMEDYLCAADLVISRSGATFLSEIAYLGKPSVLIPSPNVAENHQEINANRFVAGGASIKIRESLLNMKLFEKTILDILEDKEKMKEMGENAKLLSVPDSSRRIVDEIEKIIKK